MSRDASRAARLYASFVGEEPDRSELVKFTLPEAVACIGEVCAIEYVAERDGKASIFRHEFKLKSRPVMCIFPDGSKVLMLGGAWKFTEDGYLDG